MYISRLERTNECKQRKTQGGIWDYGGLMEMTKESAIPPTHLLAQSPGGAFINGRTMDFDYY